MSNIDIKVEPLQTYFLKDMNGTCYGYRYPSNLEMMNKINELSEKVNMIVDVLQLKKEV